MGRRSLQASEQGIQAIKKALKSKKWSQTYLAGAAGCSRQTIWSLLQGKPTDCDVFMEVCNQLGLRQEEIIAPELLEPEQDNSEHIDALVQTIRESVRPYIQEKCGMMRVLDMEQPIGLGDIYTSVNILERITGRRGLDISELMQNADPEQFDRFCLGKVREKRVPGLEAVEKFSKLMILGKPGAGKTTFLKHLAIQCIGGEFQSDRVPIFITLKDFAEADDKPNLLTYIEHLISLTIESDRLNALPLYNILRAGKALILLDGLDEVREADSSRVLRQIRGLSEQFSQNQFVITCRIAARECTFEQFTEVEVSDFDDKQIANFSNKWFRSKSDSVKTERFLQKLKEDAPIRELAASPLLLTLLCLVFEDSGSFPNNRAELYENGTDILLKRWDAKRNIERDQVYRSLSIKRKEDLLSQLALTTFESGNYFFKEREVKQHISQYIQNLPNINSGTEALELDSKAILKSIEAQHGLLLERSRGIYSFSHLTFHEYFAARKICITCSRDDSGESKIQILTNHLLERNWREIFLLTVSMLEKADVLLESMKTKVDKLLEADKELQHFLAWMSQKVSSLKTIYKPSSVRAFFIEITLDKALESLDLWHAVYEVNLYLHRGMEEELKEGQFFNFAIADLHHYSWWPRLAIKIDKAFSHHALIGSSLLTEEFGFWQVIINNAIVLQELIGEKDDIQREWKFNDKKKHFLQQYYNGVQLLVDCLNSDCYVSREVRQEIEDTLFLPIAEIEKRKQQ